MEHLIQKLEEFRDNIHPEKYDTYAELDARKSEISAIIGALQLYWDIHTKETQNKHREHPTTTN